MKAKRDIEEHLKYLHAVALQTLNMSVVHEGKVKKMIMMSNRHQIRLDKRIKRTICFECGSILVPCVNCTSRIIRKRNGLCVVTTCKCKSERTIVMRGK